MPDAIVYCDGCNKIILPSAIKEGDAISLPTKSFCFDCVKALGPDERDALMAESNGKAGGDEPNTFTPPDSGSDSHAVRRRDGSGSRLARAGDAPSFFGKVIVLAIAVAGVLAGIAVALLATGSPDEQTSQHAEQSPTPQRPVEPAARSTPLPTASAAAQQLAKIKAMHTPDLAAYGEMRLLLTKFLKYFANAPEAEGAKAMLFEIEVAYGKLADKALAAAITAAEKSASSGDFEGAILAIKSVASRFPEGPWRKENGDAKITAALREFDKRRAALKVKNAATTLAKARGQFEAGRLKEARTSIAKCKAWPDDARAKADALAREIERKLAAIAAARKLGSERGKILAEFDRLMIEGKYAAAREYADSKAAVGGETGKLLHAAGRVAQVMAEAPAARIRGAETFIGKEVRLKLVKGSMAALVKGASDAGLAIASTYRIGNKAYEKLIDLKWDALHADQKAEFARLGGLKIDKADAPAASTYMALDSGDLATARTQIESASDHPLVARLAKVVRERQVQLAYESAMELARDLAKMKRWNAAKQECEKALEIKPDDQKATALLVEIRQHMPPPPTLTLDLGGGVKMEFVYIRPGKFTMGGDGDAGHSLQGVEKPKHNVTITKGFYLGKYEVTQAQYKAVMGANPSKSKKAQGPVEQVTWIEAAEFCRKASEKTRRAVRLPMEAEWEFACRAGTATYFSHGDDPGKLGEYAWYVANAKKKTHPVGQKKPNAWGLYDTHGNVWEWVADWYGADYYASSPGEDPTGPTSGERRVLRGGGLEPAGACRSACRAHAPPRSRSTTIGFRAAVSLPPRGPRVP